MIGNDAGQALKTAQDELASANAALAGVAPGPELDAAQARVARAAAEVLRVDPRGSTNPLFRDVGTD